MIQSGTGDLHETVPDAHVLRELLRHGLYLHGGHRLVIAPLRQGVKHVLTHRIILTNFYQLTLPSGTRSLPTYQQIQVDQLSNYAFPRLITSFLDKTL